MSTSATPEVRYIIIEDSASSRRLLEIVMAQFGWVLVSVATTFAEARKLVDQVGGKNIHAAFVDGNLSPEAASAEEGMLINEALKQKAPHITRIAFSTQDDLPLGHDLPFGKKPISNWDKSVMAKLDQQVRCIHHLS